MGHHLRAMQLAFYCTNWGHGDGPIEALCERAAAAGYEGIEATLPPDPAVAGDAARRIRDCGLGLIALRWSEPLLDPTAELRAYERHLRVLADIGPEFVNSQTGRDFYDRDTNRRFLDVAAKVAAETGVAIRHETHRGRFSFCAQRTCEYLAEDPALELTADFSHWCVVSESLLEDQQALVQTAIERVRHVHCRVGHPQAAQVNDPAAPEWRAALEAHVAWWRAIVAKRRACGDNRLTLTPEFGPAPYMPELPFARTPLADQWQANRFMVEHLREALSDEPS